MASRCFILGSAALLSLSACSSDPGDSSSDSGSTAATTDGNSTDSTSSTVGESSGTTGTTSTTAPTTSTSSGSSDVGTSEATSTTATGTTGDPFICAVVDGEGCCEIEIAAEADTFFSDAVDGIGPGCPLVPPPPMGLQELACEHWSFGAAPELPLFRDDGSFIAAIQGTNVLALRFPITDDGLLMADGEPIPGELIQAVTLDLAVEIDWSTYSDLKFAIHGLAAGQGWDEGDGAVPVTACVDGLASFACRQCGDMPEVCAEPWDSPLPMTELGLVDGPQGPDVDRLSLDLLPLGPVNDWLPQIADGLIVAPSSSTYDAVVLEDQVPYGQLHVKTRESGSPPQLRLRLCQP